MRVAVAVIGLFGLAACGLDAGVSAAAGAVGTCLGAGLGRGIGTSVGMSLAHGDFATLTESDGGTTLVVSVEDATGRLEVEFDGPAVSGALPRAFPGDCTRSDTISLLHRADGTVYSVSGEVTVLDGGTPGADGVDLQLSGLTYRRRSTGTTESLADRTISLPFR